MDKRTPSCLTMYFTNTANETITRKIMAQKIDRQCNLLNWSGSEYIWKPFRLMTHLASTKVNSLHMCKLVFLTSVMQDKKRFSIIYPFIITKQNNEKPCHNRVKHWNQIHTWIKSNSAAFCCMLHVVFSQHSVNIIKLYHHWEKGHLKCVINMRSISLVLSSRFANSPCVNKPLQAKSHRHTN